MLGLEEVQCAAQVQVRGLLVAELDVDACVDLRDLSIIENLPQLVLLVFSGAPIEVRETQELLQVPVLAINDFVFVAATGLLRGARLFVLEGLTSVQQGKAVEVTWLWEFRIFQCVLLALFIFIFGCAEAQRSHQ